MKKWKFYYCMVCDNGEILIYYWINGSHWAAQMMVVQFKKKNNKYTNITNTIQRGNKCSCGQQIKDIFN